MTDLPTVTVVTADDDGDLGVPAASDSPLASLRARRQARLDTLHLDLKVPRWDDDNGPAIYVRYKPVDVAQAARVADRAEKSKAADWVVVANASVLVNACVGVFAMENGQRLSLRDGDPHGPWTRFDQDLAESLGLDGPTRATDVCKALFFTGGDLIGHAAALAEWSGNSTPEVEDATLGE